MWKKVEKNFSCATKLTCARYAKPKTNLACPNFLWLAVLCAYYACDRSGYFAHHVLPKQAISS